MTVELTALKKRDRLMPAMGEMRDHATEAAAFLKALANDQRLLVLCALLDGPLSVGDINERVPLSQSALSQHLSVLRDARLVTTTRQSQTIYYMLARGPALQIMEVLYATFCAPSSASPRAKKARCQPAKRAAKP
jgi:DNA-binding transcriptional ArsR family regulator